jgi:hypothetical protein
MRSWIAFAAILLSFHAGAQSVTEAEARIQSAFSSSLDPGVLAEDVKLGPALQKALAGDKGRGQIYAALTRRIAGQPVRVSVLSPVEAALVGGNASEPLVRLEAGGLALLMRYSPERKQVAFVEQLSAAAPAAETAPMPASAASPVESAQLPPQAPKVAPVSAVPLPATPPPAEKRAPPAVGQKSAKPTAVAAPRPAARPAAAVTPKAETKSEPVAQPTFKAAPVECEIKPVMTDDELRACGVRR